MVPARRVRAGTGTLRKRTEPHLGGPVRSSRGSNRVSGICSSIILHHVALPNASPRRPRRPGGDPGHRGAVAVGRGNTPETANPESNDPGFFAVRNWSRCTPVVAGGRPQSFGNRGNGGCSHEKKGSDRVVSNPPPTP